MLLEGNIRNTSTTSSNGTISVPRSAVLWTGNTSVVYVKLQDTEVPSYEFREVFIESQSGDYVKVLEGIQNGDEIVTKGAFAIDAAAQLNNNLSMMNRNVSIKKEAQSDITPDYTEETPDEFKKQLDVLANAYLDLKDAFVNTDPNSAAEQTDKIINAVEGVDMTLVKGDGHMYWMEQMSAIKTHTEKIKGSTDVEQQRKQFEFVSDAMIRSIELLAQLEIHTMFSSARWPIITKERTGYQYKRTFRTHTSETK